MILSTTYPSPPWSSLVSKMVPVISMRKLSSSPLFHSEGLGEFFVGHATSDLENVVGFANELHVTVLDAVVDHLHVVTTTNATDVERAWTTISLSGALEDDVFHHVVSNLGATGHERRTLAGTLFATRNAHAHEEDVLGFKLLGTANRVLEPLVTAINDEVT